MLTACAGMVITKDHSLVKLSDSSFCNITKHRPSLTELHQLINSVDSEQPCSRAVLRPLVRWHTYLYSPFIPVGPTCIPAQLSGRETYCLLFHAS